MAKLPNELIVPKPMKTIKGVEMSKRMARLHGYVKSRGLDISTTTSSKKHYLGLKVVMEDLRKYQQETPMTIIEDAIKDLEIILGRCRQE